MGQPGRTSAVRLLWTLILAAAFLLGPAARAAEPGATEIRTAFLELIVNTVHKGVVIVVLRGDDVLVAAEDLDAAGLRLPAGPSEAFEAKPYRSLAQAGSQVRFVVDEETLELRVVAAPDLLDRQLVDLRPGPPAGIEYRKDTSAFLNYAPRVIAGIDVGFEAAAELGVSHGGHLLYSGLSYGMARGPVRGLSNVTVDDRRGQRRWVLGDAFATTGTLGGGVFVGGLTLAKSFELDPYFVRTPALGFTGSAAVPSTLEVYVDGVPVRREAIEPGTFQVANLQVPGGAGVTRYVLRDAFGREQQFSAAYYMAAGLLEQGVSEYGYSIGFERARLAEASADYGSPVLLAKHRVGATKRLTLGMRAEAGVSLVSAGPTVTVALPVGQIDLAVSGSAAPDHAGTSAFFGYSYQARRASVTAFARLSSDDYATLSLAPGDERALVEGSVSSSVAVSRRASVGLQQSITQMRDAGLSTRVAATAGLQIMDGLFMNASAARISSDRQPPVLSLFAGLTYMFAGASAVVGARSEGEQREVEGFVSRPMPMGTGAGFQVGGAYGAVPRVQALGQGQTDFGRARARVAQTGDQRSAEVEISGGIVAIEGGGVFFTRPVQQGFAVLEVPGVAGVRGFLNNQDVGRTNDDGLMVIPDLLPYYGNRLSIGDADLPMDYGVSAVERVIATPLRGGAWVSFAVAKVSYHRGRVVVRKAGEDIVPSYGELVVGGHGAQAISPIGKDGEFELEGLAAGEYEGEIRYEGGRCGFTVRLPASTEAIQALGTLRCGGDGEE